MALGADRKKSSAVGLGKFEIRETSPSVGTAFQSLGHLDGESGSEIPGMIADVEEIIDETGSLVDAKTKTLVHRIGTNLLQTTLEEINVPKQAFLKEHAFRYSGMHSDDRFQYFCFPRGKINPSVALGYKNGKRVLPIRAWGLKQKELAYDVPEFYLAEARGEIRTENLQLWINPRDIYSPEAGTTRVFDISGFERFGTLNSDFATIWQTGTPDRFLRFDGVNDQCDFGNILNDDGSADFMIEVWARILAADGTQVRIIYKKADNSVNPGYSIYRDTSNKVRFDLSSGASEAEIISTTSLLQNTWGLISIAVDRNGNVSLYRNGLADATPISVAAITSGNNAINLFLARNGVSPIFNNLEIGGLRIYNFGAGGLPSDIATIILRHYNAEKSYYGL